MAADPVLAAHDRPTGPLRAWLAAVRSYAMTGTRPLDEVNLLGADAQRTWADVLAVAAQPPTHGGRPG